MNATQFQIVHDVFSLVFACMMASTAFFWLRMFAVPHKYKTALLVTGMVTFIASYHYLRIFQSWVEAYDYPAPTMLADGSMNVPDPVMSGKPFNDGYRYMDWLVTVPLLLIEIVLVMSLSNKQTVVMATKLGVAAMVMIILGYPGEVAFTPEQVQYRWIFWSASMLPFLYIVYVLIFELRKTVKREQDTKIRRLIQAAQFGTVASWLTYPIVYILPMCGIASSTAVVVVQIGYSISDILAKCGVGFLIYFVTAAKMEKDGGSNGLMGDYHAQSPTINSNA